MSLLAIDWSEVGIKAGQLILCLSILVILHEMGHFLPARWFKCRVEKFYLFFDPWFSLFKKKIGDTEYGIGWLPLGGYVKISGMIDESMDKEQLKQPPQPWEFRSKPAWQRLIIMIGGVTVNLILGFLIFGMILWIWGEKRLPMEKMQHGVMVNSISEKVGLKNGDQLISIDGDSVKDYYSLSRDIILEEAKTIQVKRDGQTLNLNIPAGTIRSLIKTKIPFVLPRVYPVVDTIYKVARFTENALKKNDHILSINNVPVTYFDEYIKEKLKYKNQEVTLS